MDEYELLIRHTDAWAGAKKRHLDTELLSSLLHLRALHDRRPGTSWPAGSAEHLLTVRWPGHGPLGAADPEAIVATLDTFWRFLRGTGRMASGSAEPKDLLREARRAMPTMQARAEDPAYFGQSKALQQFGAQIGITLEDVADMDDLNARMQQITDAWNALPDEERLARMPRTGSAGSLAAGDLAQALGSYVGNGEPGGLEPEPDDVIPVQDAAVVARQVRESGFLRSCLALTDWVGEGREVTSTGLLRPAVARVALAELALESWDRDVLRREPPVWRSAGDCLALDRLFMPAVDAGLLEVRGRRVVEAGWSGRSDLDWVHLAMRLLVPLTARASWHEIPRPLVGILLHVALPETDTVTEDELFQWWANSPRNRWFAAMANSDPQISRLCRELSDEGLSACLAFYDDTGVWRRHGGRLTITELGRDFTRVLISVLESGAIEL